MARIKIQECEVIEINLYKYDIEVLLETFILNIMNRENINNVKERIGEV